MATIPQPEGLPVHHDGCATTRVLGTLPTPRHLAFAPMADGDLIPESQWLEFEIANAPITVKDQGQFGACNGHAAAESLEWGRWVNGYPYQELSAWFVYSILCGGIDRGSSIGEALQLLSKTGTCRDSLVKHGTINPRQLGSDAQSDAGRFRIESGKSLTTFEAIASEVQRGRFGNFSIHVGSRFNDLDSEGVVPAQAGAGNHAVCFGMGMKKLRSGEWAIKFQNSWTTQWGQGGFAWFTKQHIQNQSWFEAYSVVSATADTSK